MDNTGWKRAAPHIFWSEMAPADHLRQVYENDAVLLDALKGFVTGGFGKNESCIIIATDQHLLMLERMLETDGIDTIALMADYRYIPLNAQKILSKFMVNGWPEESLFIKTIAGIMARAKGPQDRAIRAFGEMVAILWNQGHKGATLKLEDLWNRLSQEEKFVLFCAYPVTGFNEDLTNSVKNICCAHSKMINGFTEQAEEILYRDTSLVF
jgi:hypothetical protein